MAAAAAAAATTPSIAAFSNRCSPTLQSISSHAIPSKPSIQTSPASPSSLLLSADDSPTLAASVQTVSLANAAAEAALVAVSSTLALTETAFPANNEFQLEKERTPITSPVAQKRRRRTRREPELSKIGSNACFISPSSPSRYLTRREEVEFSFHLKEEARLEAVRKKIQETVKEELTMGQWAEAVGMSKMCLEEKLRRASACRERISFTYKRLIITIASQYQGKGLSLQDLVQEGRIGLLRGAQKFDPNKGCKFSTYIYWWIKQEIMKAVSTKTRIIRLPGNMLDVLAKIADANNILRSQLGRWPTHDEIAGMVNVSISTVRLVCEKTRPPISMDQPMANHKSITLKEIMKGPEETRPEVMVGRKHMKEEIDRLLKTLNGREERILRLYFGLDGETARSFQEIGRRLQLSRERARQIHCIALTKLQEAASIDSLQMYM
ncbi:hypothetical protein ACLOJK_015907 [Asimina triloba]